jgi:hypothetical protein
MQNPMHEHLDFNVSDLNDKHNLLKQEDTMYVRSGLKAQWLSSCSGLFYRKVTKLFAKREEPKIKRVLCNAFATAFQLLTI